ncbi:hmg box [Fusarium albosuccineum]|uniref:Hmg box n=1 Tax=Fusarium albosuccineum TaxID=1237068 RepID=A0A8H4L600_9HYPO|nr:hmg box [Fusarium albosuccineum]
MLTSIGRAAARRIQTSRLHSTTVARAQLLCRENPAISTLAVRSFSVSAGARLPAAGSKKPTKKTTATKKPAATKSAKATKPKPKPKPKSKAPGEKPKKKPKKEVDPEKKKKLEIRELKKWVLNDKLTPLPRTSWTQFVFEKSGPVSGGIISQISEISRQFKSLSPAETKNLEDTAAANREKNAANYKAWVETHEPARIYIANQARNRIAFLTGKPAKTIKDERLPKQPVTSFILYATENYSQAGERADTPAPERMKTISNDWKQMSPAEKAPYEERSRDALAKFHAEMGKVRARVDVIKKAATEE